jgi:hypothetical protein
VNSLTGQYFDGRHPLGVAATLMLSDRLAGLLGQVDSRQYDT